MFKICIFYKWFFIIKPYGRQTPSFVNPIVTSHFKSTQKKKNVYGYFPPGFTN